MFMVITLSQRLFSTSEFLTKPHAISKERVRIGNGMVIDVRLETNLSITTIHCNLAIVTHDQKNACKKIITVVNQKVLIVTIPNFAIKMANAQMPIKTLELMTKGCLNA